MRSSRAFSVFFPLLVLLVAAFTSVRTSAQVRTTLPKLTVCPVTQTKCPVVLTQCPPSLTKCPVVLTKCPTSLTKCPAVKTKCPPVATTCPPAALTPFNSLVGWVDGTPNGSVFTQQTPSQGCKFIDRCPTVLTKASTPWAGGSGYDPRFQATWSSDGITIELRSLRDCKVICRGKATLILPNTGSRVSGLAVNDSRSRLYQLETAPGFFGIVVYDISDPKKSCFKIISKCTGKTLTPKGTAGGLAFDEARRVLFIGTSEPTSAGNTHHILVTSAASPCVVRCRYQIPSNCLDPKRLLSGLAYDCCPKRTLYVTDGARNLELATGDSTRCQFTPGRCCPASGPYRGLAMIPGWTLKHVGKNCLGKPCPSCPNMYMGTSGGDPSLGNPDFSLDLVNAPGGLPTKFAILYLRVGACGPGLPIFCGAFHPLPFHLGPFVVPISGAGCNGFAKVPLPIPALDALCGLKLCSQYLILCPSAAGLGVGLSNAIEFRITGS